MKKSLIAGVFVGAAVAMAGGALAGYHFIGKPPAYAQVVAVKPVEKTIRTPRQECRDETPKPRCETVYDTHIERSGYDVRYRIGNEEGEVRMGHDPGDRIPLRAGQLVLKGRTGRG